MVSAEHDCDRANSGGAEVRLGLEPQRHAEQCQTGGISLSENNLESILASVRDKTFVRISLGKTGWSGIKLVPCPPIHYFLLFIKITLDTSQSYLKSNNPSVMYFSNLSASVIALVGVLLTGSNALNMFVATLMKSFPSQSDASSVAWS